MVPGKIRSAQSSVSLESINHRKGKSIFTPRCRDATIAPSVQAAASEQKSHRKFPLNPSEILVAILNVQKQCHHYSNAYASLSSIPCRKSTPSSPAIHLLNHHSKKVLMLGQCTHLLRWSRCWRKGCIECRRPLRTDVLM